ncbi:MAG: RNA polymerase sigma factor [Candidatus Cryptobacteroides sp.]
MLGLGRKNDVDFVKGVAGNDNGLEREFYFHCHQYFRSHCRAVLIDVENMDDLFQEAFLVVWTEMQSGKIRVNDSRVCRRRNGEYVPMTCSLATFVMDIARNMNRKALRSAPVKVDVGTVQLPDDEETDDKEDRLNAIAKCIAELPARCREILTMFYYKKMSLDEILAARKENISKDGLKTGKSKCMKKLKENVLTRMNENV